MKEAEYLYAASENIHHSRWKVIEIQQGSNYESEQENVTLGVGIGLAVTLVSICSDQVKKPICFISHFSKIMEYIVFIMFIYKLILTRNKLTFNNPIVDNCYCSFVGLGGS